MEYVSKYDSPLGVITLASDGENITGLWIENQKYYAMTLSKYSEKEIDVFREAKKWLDLYFSGNEPKMKLPLKPSGSNFRKDVWKILEEIPYGKVITYGEIAKKLSVKYQKNMSAQAVGGAVGHNPISIIIPCHRVVGTNGSLTGYAGGIDKKIQLLQLEKVDMTDLFIPEKGTAI